MTAVALTVAVTIDEDPPLSSVRAIAIFAVFPFVAVSLVLGLLRWRWWRVVSRIDRELLVWSLLFLVGLCMILLPGDQALDGLADLFRRIGGG